jgi:hypothetical protein
MLVDRIRIDANDRAKAESIAGTDQKLLQTLRKLLLKFGAIIARQERR